MKKSVCHNELDQLDYTYRNAMDDLKEALAAAEPRWEGEGRKKVNVRYKKV